MPLNFVSLLKKKEEEIFVSVDIGTSSIKLLELSQVRDNPTVIAFGIAPTPAGAVNNNVVTNPKQVGAVIRSLLDANKMTAERASVALPGPAVFSKRITMAAAPVSELQSLMAFEANNYIPQSIGAVHTDFQVVAKSGPSSIEVLLVAVRNEIIQSYRQALIDAGLEPSIADVDYFALENMFDLNYPEERTRTIALVNIGSRYTTINILRNGISLFTGDVAVGGRLYTDALHEALEMKPVDAERAKLGESVDGFDANAIREILDRTTDHVTTELHRQIGFFWNAAATDSSIDGIFVSGGGSRIRGLLDELSTRTGMECVQVDPFRKVNVPETFDKNYLQEASLSLGVSVGLALRRLGDKVHVMSEK